MARDRQVLTSVTHGTVLTLHDFFDDITLWGWAESLGDSWFLPTTCPVCRCLSPLTSTEPSWLQSSALKTPSLAQRSRCCEGPACA